MAPSNCDSCCRAFAWSKTGVLSWSKRIIVSACGDLFAGPVVFENIPAGGRHAFSAVAGSQRRRTQFRKAFAATLPGRKARNHRPSGSRPGCLAHRPPSHSLPPCASSRARRRLPGLLPVAASPGPRSTKPAQWLSGNEASLLLRRYASTIMRAARLDALSRVR
jgi:hypothetical protein